MSMSASMFSTVATGTVSASTLQNQTSLPAFPDDMPVVHLILTIYGSVIIAFGTIGNMISLRIFWNSDKFKESTHLLLIILQIADTLVLVFAAGRHWLMQTYHYDIRNSNFFVCIGHVVITYVCTDFAIWILCFIVVDRFVAVTYPMQSKVIITKPNVIKAVLALLVFVLAKDIPLIFSHFWKPNNMGQPACMYKKNFFKYFVIVDSGFSFLVPDSLIFIFNIVIFCNIRSYQRKFAEMKSSTNSNKGANNHRGRQIAAARIALATGTIHLFTTLPSAMYLFSHSFLDYKSNTIIVNNILMILCFTNSAINFLVYLPMDKKFRSSFSDMVSPECSNMEGARRLMRSSVDLSHRNRLPVLPEKDNIEAQKLGSDVNGMTDLEGIRDIDAEDAEEEDYNLIVTDSATVTINTTPKE